VISVEVSDETMTERLLKRGETSGRADDNLDTIKSRIKLFHDATKPVCDYYDNQGKLERINAEKEPAAVFADIKKAVDKRNSILIQKRKKINLLLIVLNKILYF
jgi:adenylate kinase family enzyme